MISMFKAIGALKTQEVVTLMRYYEFCTISRHAIEVEQS